MNWAAGQGGPAGIQAPALACTRAQRWRCIGAAFPLQLTCCPDVPRTVWALLSLIPTHSWPLCRALEAYQAAEAAAVELGARLSELGGLLGQQQGGALKQE